MSFNDIEQNNNIVMNDVIVETQTNSITTSYPFVTNNTNNSNIVEIRDAQLIEEARVEIIDSNKSENEKKKILMYTKICSGLIVIFILVLRMMNV